MGWHAHDGPVLQVKYDPTETGVTNVQFLESFLIDLAQASSQSVEGGAGAGEAEARGAGAGAGAVEGGAGAGEREAPMVWKSSLSWKEYSAKVLRERCVERESGTEWGEGEEEGGAFFLRDRE